MVVMLFSPMRSYSIYLSQCRRKDTLNELQHVVYWYGVRDESSFYGFVAQKDLVTYQQGLDRGYFKPYAAVQQKVAEKKKLNKGEQDRLLAINELNEDLQKQPEERKRGVTDFPEVWDLLTYDDIDDLDSSSSEEAYMDGSHERMNEDGDDLNGGDAEPEPQKYARKKSYHDSHRPSNNAFVHVRSANGFNSTISVDAMNQDGSAHEARLSADLNGSRTATITPFAPVTTDGKRFYVW